ncbi:hypothetical protein [Pseudomonas sp. REB1044]|uniref:hypothetical protein n=1 Tax=Pseudomonas sp. REB1044 TaxID=2675224 RepID=UPI00315CE93B
MAWDVSDAIDAKNKSKPILATAFGIRTGATFALLVGQGGIAFSQASALFRWLSISDSNMFRSSLSATLSRLSARLAANRVAMLWLSRLSWIGGAVVLATSIALLILDENALEKWCSKCCFRLQLSHPGYAEDAEELEALLYAISEVI